MYAVGLFPGAQEEEKGEAGRRKGKRLTGSAESIIMLEVRRCTQVVVRGRTRNAIGPQGRVGSTPTISALKKDCCSYSNPFLVDFVCGAKEKERNLQKSCGNLRNVIH